MRLVNSVIKLAIIMALLASLSTLMTGAAGAASLWSTETTVPFPREAMAVVQAGDTIYTIGGYNDDGVSITDGYREIVEAYDLSTGVWTCSTDDPAATGCASKTLAPTPSRRWHTGAAAGNGKIYLVGGDDFYGDVSTFEIYDIANNSWSSGPSMKDARDFPAAAVGYDGKLYVFGGVGLPRDSMEIYDPGTNSWSYGADLPSGRGSAAVVSDPTGRKIYLLGGYRTGAAGDGITVFMYDIDSNSWSTGTPMNTERSLFGATFVGNHLYAVGGLDPNSTEPSAEAYDATQDVWVPIGEQMPGSDFHVKAFTGADGNIYAVTTSSRTLDTIYKLDTTDQTAPTTNATAKNADDSSYSFGDWTGQNVTVTLSATDSGAGVAKTYYTIDAGETKTYSVPFTVSGTGTHTISYWSTDNIANIEEAKTATVKIDATAPETTASAKNADLSAYTSGDWTNQSVTVTLSASYDNGSGIDHISYAIDGGAMQTYANPINFTSEGYYQLSYWGVDKVNNDETHHTFIVKIDTSAPTASYAFENVGGETIAPNSAGWINQPVTVTLTCSDPLLADNASGSGVASCPSMTLDAEGLGQSTSLTATDNAGNSHIVHVIGVNIDLTDPDFNCAVADGDWHKDDVSIACTASDALSGLKNSDDASFTLSTSVPTNTESVYAATNSHQVCDAADRCVTAGPVTGNKIDKKGPTITGSASSNGQPYTAGDWTNHDVTVTFFCSDGGSGLATCSDPVTISTEGVNQSVPGTATDQVGNDAETSFTGINIDKTSPVITYSGNRPTYAITDRITIACDASDALSGVASTTCQEIDAAAYQFGAGTHTITADATDLAGNDGRGDVTFTVGVSADGLCSLTGEMVDNPRTARRLCAPLRLVEWAEAMHNQRMKTSAISSYKLLVSMQAGRSLTVDEANLLLELADEL